MTAGPTPWLTVREGDAPLIVAFPHTGTDIPREIERSLVSPWLSRRDADWWVDQLYAFVANLGATTVRTAINRTVIDVNRDPTGASLYPGQATTELCPTTTFDGEPLYHAGQALHAEEIAERRARYFEPYHQALTDQIARLKARHGRVVVYDAHSIRSRIPRLFEGELPVFNIGTNQGATCAGRLTAAVEAACDASGLPRVTNGRFKGGWTARRYGDMDEPAEPTPDNWPSPYDPARAAPLRAVLTTVLQACLACSSRTC